LKACAARSGNLAIPEAPRRGRARSRRPLRLVDPDGTKEFISRNGEFTVNIALIENGAPILGVVHAPALARIFWGEKGVGAAQGMIGPDGDIAWKDLHVRPCPADGLTVVASRSHRDAATDGFLKK
jgi:3'-phosphoadenosine 5'-phosphosulfate (PAPS) 3'-phosphatase